MIIIEQSAVIPFKKGSNGIEILLVSTRKKNWTIPKGIVEDGLNPVESALKEALEEAGITGSVKKKKTGTYRYKKWGDVCEVAVYKMKVKKVHKKWEEENFRKRIWVELKDIPLFLKKKKLIKIIFKAFENE
jgi:phosphohistidine phosphatase